MRDVIMNGPDWWRYWAAGPDSPIAGHSWSYRADTDTGGQHTQTKHYHLLSTSPQSWPEQTIDDCKTFINEYAYYDRMSYAEKKYICRAIKGKRSWYKRWIIMIPWPVQRLLIGLDNSSPDSWRPARTAQRAVSLYQFYRSPRGISIPSAHWNSQLQASNPVTVTLNHMTSNF